MVESVRGRKGEIRAKVSVLYESERPSGCSDFVYTSSHRAQLAVVIDKETGDASVEVTDHEEMDDRDEEGDDVDVGDDDGPREF